MTSSVLLLSLQLFAFTASEAPATVPANAPVATCASPTIPSFAVLNLPLTQARALAPAKKLKIEKLKFDFAKARQVSCCCTGEECGCDVQWLECESHCPPPEDPGYDQCDQQCTHQYMACAKACCIGGW